MKTIGGISNSNNHIIATSKKNRNNKHNAELQRADPGTKDVGQYSTRTQGRIFPHNAQNGILLIP